MGESDPTCPLCKDKQQTLEHLSSCKTALGNGRPMGGTWRHNKFIKNYMKSESTISTKKFVSEKGRIYVSALSKQSNIELYSVKTFLDQVEIGKYLLTYQDGIMITQKQYLAKVCNQILFFCQGRILKSSWWNYQYHMKAGWIKAMSMNMKILKKS